MRFTCSAEKIIEGLQTVVKALPARTTNPVLEGILIETSEDELVLTCSDERFTIVTRVEASIQEHGRGIVPGKLFNEIARRLTNGDVDVSMNNNYLFTILNGQSRTNISGQDPDLYPLLPKMENGAEICLPQNMLKDMIQRTEFCIAQEDMREVLTGGYLEIAGGAVTMVGLDGFRLALSRAQCAEIEKTAKAIIPGRAIGDIGKLLSDDPEAFLNLTLDGSKLRLKIGSTEVYVILIGGEYVNFRRIIQSDFQTRVYVALDEIRSCVDRASLIARDGNNNQLILKIHGETMTIEAHSQIGDVHEELSVQHEGSDLNISFNVKYLIDAVRCMESEQIVMNMNTPLSPCVITPANCDDYINLILPLRTGDAR